MRWIAFLLVVGCGLVAGCQDAKKDMEPEQTAAIDYGAFEPDFYVTDQGVKPNPATATTDYVVDDYLTQATPSSTWEPVQASAKTHVVLKGDTLYGLARMYYDSASRWKDIYEANRGVLSSPHLIRIGQELMIP